MLRLQEAQAYCSESSDHMMIHWAKEERDKTEKAKKKNSQPGKAIPGAQPVTMTRGQKRSLKRKMDREAKEKEAATKSAEPTPAREDPQKTKPPASFADAVKNTPATNSTSAASSAQQAGPATHQDSPATTDENKVRSLRTELNDVMAEKWATVSPALGPVLKGLMAEVYPKARDDLSTPEETVQEALKKSQSCSGTQDCAAAEEEVAALKESLTALEKLPASDDVATLIRQQKELLARKETSRAKTAKAVPSAERELSGLIAAKAAFVEQMQAREDRVKATATAATRRKEERHASLRKMAQELEDFVKELAGAEEALKKEHEERAKNRAEFQEKVLQLYDQRMGEARARGPSAPGNPATAVDETHQLQQRLQAQQHAATSAQQAAGAAERVARDTASQLRQLQQELEAAKAAGQREVQKRREEAAAQEAFQLYVPEVRVDNLPLLTMPSSTEKLFAHGQLHQLLQSWSDAGAAIPFSFNDLTAHTTFAAECPMVIRSILGTQWPKWFVENPGATQTVPRQAAIMCLQALDKLKQAWLDHLEVQTKIAAEAAGTYTSMCGTVKRRRSVVNDAEMGSQ